MHDPFVYLYVLSPQHFFNFIHSRDNTEAIGLLGDDILPMVQYFAYLEVNEPGHGTNASSLWRAYETLGDQRLAQRAVTQREEIYPIFRELFSRSKEVRGRTA